ncbi:MAG: tRNA dihydrouridine(20/20a) synthase DusA [Gammaproteobacteria bacterium]|nr:tRNA dihydrouridine(20/20a) synthase DusA [Gammaproteobacteria bacterium]
MLNRRYSVAPMMAWTDSACRQFHRYLAPSALLYTEMVTTGALLYGDVDLHLRYNSAEHPLALQLGGADPEALAKSILIAESYDYDEYNLNVGCPSDRVQSGRFGAALMAEPELVGRCVAAMKAVTDKPVTVKCRIGIDRDDSYELFAEFVDTVQQMASPDCFIVHARKAWLDGLSPKENREIPPLRYDYVHRLKQERPALSIIINGGFGTQQALDPAFIGNLQGAMVGRDAYQNPYELTLVEPEASRRSYADVVTFLADLCEARLSAGESIWGLMRHTLGLFNGKPGARHWRRYLSENANQSGATSEVVIAAAAPVLARLT